MYFDEHKPIDPATRESELKLAGEIRGNPDKFAQYVDAQRPRLMHMIRDVLRKHKNEWEDAFQECALKIYNGLPNFKGESTLDTWSYRVSVNRTLGIFKHLEQTVKNSDTVFLEDQVKEGKDGKKIPFDVPSSGPSPLDKALIHERLGQLDRAIRNLPPPFQSVFVLSEIQGFSTDETAEAVGAKSSTVRSRLFRARTQVTAYVESEEKSKRRPSAEGHHSQNEPRRTSRGLPIWHGLMQSGMPLSHGS